MRIAGFFYSPSLSRCPKVGGLFITAEKSQLFKKLHLYYYHHFQIISFSNLQITIESAGRFVGLKK